MLVRSLIVAGLLIPILAVDSRPQTPSAAALKVRHVHIWVTDVERTKAFYRDKLGLKVTNERAGQNVEFEGGTLWFGKFRGTGALQTNGITIGIESNNVNATYQTLKQRGLNLPHPPEKRPYGVSFHLQDPDGYAIEIEGER